MGADVRPERLDAPRLFRFGGVPPFENDQRAQHARRLRPRDHLFEIAAELLIRQVTVGVNHDAAHSPLVSS